MRLSRLLKPLAPHGPFDADQSIDGLCYDSRQITKGDLFIALQGLKASGSEFANDAIHRGAAAVVSELPAPGGVTVPWIVVDDARTAMALLSDEFYSHPSRELSVVGITGTNGKTTTAYLLRALFEAAGMKSGLLGTVAYMIGNEEVSASRTTPEAPDVQRMLRQMVDRGCAACVMEVSSHALARQRGVGSRFAAGVFTNLTRDHLDYHKDMESYFSAKRRLFDMLPGGAPSVINLDDPRGDVLARAASRPVTYAITKPADVTPGPLSFTWKGLDFDARTPHGEVHVHSRLVGRPNVSNILAAVSAATALQLPIPAIETGLASLEGVPGRFQVVSHPDDGIAVVVDYAHTDDALKNLLETARPLAEGRVITVFGCGGDRDRTKRPLMGAVASRLSDVVIVTSDNPRTEDPARIIDEIKLGIQSADRKAGAFFAIVDRAAAIDQAIKIA